MLKFFEENIKKPTDELVRLAEENRRAVLGEEEETLEVRGDDIFEDEQIKATQ